MNSGTTSYAGSVVESLTHTLLYEGYSLYPYYRSAIKNQKPIPFGVIFPEAYNAYHQHSYSKIQSQCIISASDDPLLSVNVRFLHLRQTEIYQKETSDLNDDFAPVFSADINGKIHQSGWQTIERKMIAEDMPLSALIDNGKTFEIEFDKMNEGEFIFNEKNEVAAKQIVTVSELKGIVTMKADMIADAPGCFRLTVTVTNTTPVENAATITRDEAMSQSFLSTNIILQIIAGEFISHQDPPEQWKNAIEACDNINTWPILIDKSNTTLLSSPIILCDYPEINPKSSGDLFDSTEIEEALLLHINLFSEEEKKKIGGNDEKLQAMLDKVNSLTPEDLSNYHSMMKDSASAEFSNR